MRAALVLLGALVAATLVAAAHVPAGSAESSLVGDGRFARLPVPVLVEQAIDSGALDTTTGTLYLAYALFQPASLPPAYQSSTPFHGTVWLKQIRSALETMPEGAAKAETLALVGASGETTPGTSVCELSPLPTTSTLETAHFYIEYNALEIATNLDGLTISDYANSLEHAWTTEVDRFGWAAPPANTDEVLGAAPNGKYLVKVQNLGPVLYGYVSNLGTGAGLVGDNPNTSWDDQDAYASCMGLNSDYSNFPGTPLRALDATTAHEFNHSIQFGYGALSGANEPDSAFVEGGATWMEDEVFDYANDNYNYLWPTFENDMGDYEDSPYPYWITWRGLTERYGASRPGAGENVMQRFWELTSQNAASNLEALDRALREKGTTLAAAYSAYAVAVKFNRACGGGYSLPYCFEEGRQYVNGDGVQTGAGETEPHGTILAVPGSHAGTVPDNYALNWVVMPRITGSYRATFTNTSAGGLFRVTLACDTGTKLTLTTLQGGAGPGQTASTTVRKSLGCQQLVAVITNVAQTAANPAASEERGYALTTS
jgi:hypothetical protein